MALRDDLKAAIVKSGRTMKSVLEELNEKNGRQDSLQNLSGKMSRGTLRYTEVEEILDLIGYDIVWQKRQ